MDCSYIGDSIAIGSQQYDRGCSVHAIVGVSSNFITRNFSGRGGDSYTIISMGSNNPMSLALGNDAQKLRSSLRSRNVVWILPYDSRASRVILTIANKNGDKYVYMPSENLSNPKHPRSYRDLSNRIKSQLRGN